MAWCCFEALGVRSLLFASSVLFAADFVICIYLSKSEWSSPLLTLYITRLIATPALFFSGYRYWKAKVISVETSGEYVDLEGASQTRVLASDSSIESIRSFIDYQRQLHAVKSRGIVLINILSACVFILQTGCSVYCGITAITLGHPSQAEGVCFTLLIIIINMEFFALKNVVDMSTEEHGENLPSLHLHPVFFTNETKMHRCDICSDRIKEEAYRCKTCDFDLCLKCYKRRHRGNNYSPIESHNISLSTFFIRSLKLSLAFWPLLTAALVTMIACQAVSLLNPSVQGRVFDSIIKQDYNTFRSLITEYLIINACLGILASLQSLSLELVGRKLAFTAREQLFASIISQDVTFFDSVHTGILTSRLNNDVNAMVGPAKTLLNDLLANSFLMVGGGVMCLVTDWRMTVLALTSVTPITYAYNVYYRWSRQLNRTIWAAVSDATEVATEAFSNFRTVRAFGAEELEIRRFNLATGLASKAATTAAYIGATVKVYSRYVDSAATVLVLWYGGNQALTPGSGVSLGVLIAFQLYWNILNNAFNSLSGVVGDLISASSAAERVYSLMDARPAVDANAGVEPDNLRFDLTVDRVSFSYKTRPGNQVLDDVALRIEAGRVTALVGRSGSGKSTLMHLLLRLYDPTSGRILLSNVPLTALKISSIRSHIGLVAQDTQLFAQSIFQNITYGLDRQVPLEEVVEAAKSANAHEFITEMDEGYDTKIGEKGVLLSGGQRQRIAIARCFLRKPKLLLLDEATSALDAENESLVQTAIDTLIAKGDSTVVLIAHRLSTVMNADKIAVMSKGKIVEQGTHAELTSDPNGVYSQLVARQMTMEADRLKDDNVTTVDKLFDALEKK